MTERGLVPVEIVDELRTICLGLPEAYEEDAWVGTRWCVRKRTFAHVLRVEAGWPPAYARAVGSDGPGTVLMFRAAGPDLDALRKAGPPFFDPPWRADEIGVALGDDTGWDEISELVTESFCVMAPKALAAGVERPAPD